MYNEYKLAHFTHVINLYHRKNIQEEIDELKGETKSLLGKLESIKEQLELFSSDAQDNPTPVLLTNVESKKIFIAHGHDNDIKEAVARLLEQLNLKYVILHEEPSQGLTIIEKFEKNASESSFAVVLLTPDDKGFGCGLERPRQNVILELGYFIGKLGRNRVCALYKSNTEIPSDIHGIVYVPFDEKGAGKRILHKNSRALDSQLILIIF